MTFGIKCFPNIVSTAASAIRRNRQRPSRITKRAYSLIEMIITIMVVGVLISMGIPRFQQSLEQARANVAGANLQAIWSAERLYWLNNRMYAIDVNTALDTLLAANPSSPLIDVALTTTTASVYLQSDQSRQRRHVHRDGDPQRLFRWSGDWTIDQNGQTGGSILQAGQASNIVLGFQ